MYVVEYIYQGTRRRDETIDMPAEVRRRYSQEGKVVLSIKKKLIFQSVPQEEVVAFLTAMGDLAGSGVHTTNALDSVIASFPEKSPFPPMLRKIRDAVANGMPLGTAIESYQHVFGRTIVAMIKYGEHAGRLAETFITCAEYIMNQDEIKKELWKKLTYPGFTALIGIVSLVVNSTVVIPRLMKSELFKMANAAKGAHQHDLGSYCIQGMKYMSIVVPSFLVLVICLIFGGILLCRHNQEEAEKRLVAIPGVREFIFYRAYFVAFSSLAKLVEVGVKMDEALEIVEKSTTFIIIRKQLAEARRYIRDGQSFVKGLTALTAVERTMLDTSQNVTRIHRNFNLIAARYQRLYLDKVRSLSPKVQTAVIIMVVAIFALEFLGIMLPYAKILGSFK